MYPKICSFGECMIEIIHQDINKYNQSYAGDTFNFAVYLSRQKMKIDYLTAVGTSSLSKSYLKFMKKEKISIKLVMLKKNKELGIYLNKNKASGEKDFYYWRDESAAKFFFNNFNFNDLVHKLKNYDYVYFSGITLSIMKYSSQLKLQLALKKLRKKNLKVIFDLNIRKKIWKNKKTINKALQLFLPFTDFLFASGEDMVNWKKKMKLINILKYLKKFGIPHIVYRKDAKNNYVIYQNKIFYRKNKIYNKVVDTAGAGDAFNANYFSTFIKTNNIMKSLQNGHSLGKKVVMKKGAII